MPEIPLPPQLQQLSSARISVGWPRTLFSVSVAFVILVVAAYLILITYKGVLSGRTGNLESEINNLAGAVPAGELERLTKLDRQIRNLYTLLNERSYVSLFLSGLEGMTLPQVRYTSVEIDRLNFGVRLTGVATSMEEVSLQTAAFVQSPGIVDARFSTVNVSPDGRGVEFDAELLFNPRLVSPYLPPPEEQQE